MKPVNKDLNNVSHRLVFSLLSVRSKVVMCISLVVSQGGGIHAEEEFNPWIRVCCSFSPGK